MKKHLPRFLLLTDPYDSIEGRTLIFRTQTPRYVFELNHPNDADTAHEITVGGVKYSISVRRNLNDVADIPLSYLRDAVQWYHYSLPGNERAV